MTVAPLPQDEKDRLDVLRRLDVLDSGPEPEFDALVRAASLACGMPIALISLIDSERQWFKANTGLPGATETPRDSAFCAHAILEQSILEVRDTHADARFFDNPLVLGAPGIRFYAGAPVEVDGARIGTLCVIDSRPNALDPTQRAILASLAEAAGAALAGRRATRALHASEARFRSLAENAPHGVFLADAWAACHYANAQWHATFGYVAPCRLGQAWCERLLQPGRQAFLDEWRRCVEQDLVLDLEARILGVDNQIRTVRIRAQTSRDGEGRLLNVIGSIEDISARRQQEERLRKSELFLDRSGRLAGVGGWEMDLRDGAIIWSDHTCRIMGVPAGHRPTMEEAINCFLPSSRAAMRAAVIGGMQQGQGWDLELAVGSGNGPVTRVRAVGGAELEHGRAVRLFGAFQDITARVLEREALQRANERLTLATEFGGFGIFDSDLARGEQLWDAGMFRLYGLAPREGMISNQMWSNYVHPDDRAATEAAARMALLADSVFDTEFRVVWDDASVHWLRGTGRVVRDEQGRAVRMVGTTWSLETAPDKGAAVPPRPAGKRA